MKVSDVEADGEAEVNIGVVKESAASQSRSLSALRATPGWVFRSPMARGASLDPVFASRYPTAMATPTRDLIPPQADDLAEVRRVIEAVELGQPVLPATRPRHRQYYTQAARVLGLVDDTLGGLGTTELGRRLLQTPVGSAEERAALQVAVRTSALLRELAPDLLDEPPPTEGELGQRIERLARLAPSTALRRARTLLFWSMQLRAASTAPAPVLAPLNRLGLTHFRSFLQGELALGPLTVLVGPNGAGKSNLVDGLEFLHRWFTAGGWAGYREGPRGRLAHFDHAAFGLEVGWGAPAAGRAVIRYSSQDESARYEALWAADDHLVFSMQWDGQHFAGRHTAGWANSFETGPALPTLTDDPVALPLIQALQALRVHAFQPARMRDYHTGRADRLAGDGHNLSGVLAHLWPVPENRRALLGLVAQLPEQPIADLEFLYGPRQEVMVQVVETFGQRRRRVDAVQLSDGTLRALALGAAVLSAPPGAQIVIEDLEDGLHPSRLAFLVARLTELLQARQVRLLTTTHSPALLDALPDALLAGVVAVYRGEQGESRLCPLTELATLPALLARRSLGGLLSSGLLERALHDTRTADESARQHRAWLDQFVQALP